MSFEEYKPNKNGIHKYDGINVGLGQVSLSILMAKRIKERGWRRVTILLDKHNGFIRMQKAAEDKGFKVDWQSIGAHLHKEIPTGRYLLHSQNSTSITLLFHKLSNEKRPENEDKMKKSTESQD